MPTVVCRDYEERYHDGVVSCVKRNFTEMADYPEEIIRRWMEPMFHYSWQDRLPKDQRYRNGIVMLADDEVIGYTGCFFSERRIGGKSRIVCNVTTTAIDERYRLYLFKMQEEIMRVSDMVITYTPVDSLRTILEDRFHFQYFERENYKFYPVPCVRKKLTVRFLRDESEIVDDEIRLRFHDHLPYGMRCMAAEDHGRRCYVLYRRIRKKLRVFGRERYIVPFLSVMEVSDRGMFGAHAHEMIWAMQKREKAFLESDGRFFGGEIGDGARYKQYETWRMAWSADDAASAAQEGALYSELSVLGDYRYGTADR